MQHEDLLTDYLSVASAAKALHVHPHTLKRWRWNNYGPQPVKVGGRMYYRASEIQRWLASLSEHDATARA
jgi:predicted DNA-binding transcriptional regulator AlpA